MEKIIKNYPFERFAYTNAHLISGKIKGIALSFLGLGANFMLGEDWNEAKDLAKENVLQIIPYYNPWSWMNEQAVEYTDELVENAYEIFGVDKSAPLVSTGGSMGGQAALVYPHYSSFHPVAVVCSCPVCDVVYHFTERPDLPRTLYSAVWNYHGSLEDGLKRLSPLHIADRSPDIPYSIFHCDKDSMVDYERHSATYVRKMKELGRNIELITVPGREHCDLSPEAYECYIGKIAAACK